MTTLFLLDNTSIRHLFIQVSLFMEAPGLQGIRKVPYGQYLSNISEILHLPSLLHDSVQPCCRVKQVHAKPHTFVETQVFSHPQTTFQSHKYSFYYVCVFKSLCKAA